MNERSVIQVQIFDRSVEEEMFLGMTEIRPKLVNGHTVDQWFPYVRPGWLEGESNLLPSGCPPGLKRR